MTNNKFFGYDLYRRFLQQFGIVVLGVRQSTYITIEQRVMHEENVTDILSLSDEGMKRIVERFKEITNAPIDGTQQLIMTIDAMYEWWTRHHPDEKTLSYGMSGVSIIVQVTLLLFISCLYYLQFVLFYFQFFYLLLLF